MAYRLAALDLSTLESMSLPIVCSRRPLPVKMVFLFLYLFRSRSRYLSRLAAPRLPLSSSLRMSVSLHPKSHRSKSQSLPEAVGF